MLSLLFIALAGVFKACKDVVNFRYYVSIFRHINKPQWFNPKNSWKNKHYWFNGNKVLNWLIRYPFVVITDAWHFFGGLRSLSIIMAIVMYEPVFDNMLIMIALLWLCHSVVFTLGCAADKCVYAGTAVGEFFGRGSTDRSSLPVGCLGFDFSVYAACGRGG